MGHPVSSAGVNNSCPRCSLRWRPTGSGWRGCQRQSQSLQTCSATPLAIAGVRGWPCWSQL
jgi:hypothetical protein